MVAQSVGMLFPGRLPLLLSSSLRLKNRRSRLFQRALLLFSTSDLLQEIRDSLGLWMLKCWLQSFLELGRPLEAQ
jgi:hypothetical protein